MGAIEFNFLERNILDVMHDYGITEKLQEAWKNGEPGMCLAQIAEDGTIRMGFIPHEQALEIQKIRGNVGKIIWGD